MASPLPFDVAKNPRYKGLLKPDIVDVHGINQLGSSEGYQQITLLPSLVPLAQLPLLNEKELPPDIVVQHYDYPDPPAIKLYSAEKHVIWGNGLVTGGSNFFAPVDCIPSYIVSKLSDEAYALPWIWGGAIENDDVYPVRIDVPVASCLHPNLVYGHFLLENFPRLYLLSAFRQMGGAFRLAVSRNVHKWVLDFIRVYFSDADILWYDHTKNCVIGSSVILPSMMHTAYNFHPLINLAITDMICRAYSQSNELRAPPQLGSRLYISRAEHSGDQRLENEDEVVTLFADLGFTIVHPQEMSIKDQVVMFSRAKVIAGDYSSALHNSIFAPAGALVISLNRINWFQDCIGRLRQQHILYITPEDGAFRDWRLTGGGARHYRIDLSLLRDSVSVALSKFGSC